METILTPYRTRLAFCPALCLDSSFELEQSWTLGSWPTQCLLLFSPLHGDPALVCLWYPLSTWLPPGLPCLAPRSPFIPFCGMHDYVNIVSKDTKLLHDCLLPPSQVKQWDMYLLLLCYFQVLF